MTHSITTASPTSSKNSGAQPAPMTPAFHSYRSRPNSACAGSPMPARIWTTSPPSFALPDSLQVHANVDVERVIKTVHNVAGYLPGETDEYVIIGAHFDHLGLGEQFSMAPSLAGTTVHPGADDNASGTAGVIELARWFAGRPKDKRGILFVAFAGEELGLLGSSFYVSHPALPLAKAVAMINLDMIGRVREGKIYVGGVGT